MGEYAGHYIIEPEALLFGRGPYYSAGRNRFPYYSKGRSTGKTSDYNVSPAPNDACSDSRKNYSQSFLKALSFRYRFDPQGAGWSDFVGYYGVRFIGGWAQLYKKGDHGKRSIHWGSGG